MSTDRRRAAPLNQPTSLRTIFIAKAYLDIVVVIRVVFAKFLLQKVLQKLRERDVARVRRLDNVENHRAICRMQGRSQMPRAARPSLLICLATSPAAAAASTTHKAGAPEAPIGKASHTPSETRHWHRSRGYLSLVQLPSFRAARCRINDRAAPRIACA